MLNSPIRFVYFDLGNVLVAFDRQLVCGNVSRLYGVDARLVDEILHDESPGSGLQFDLESGRIDEVEFGQTLHRRLSDGNARSPAVAKLPDVLRAISDMFTPVASMRAVVAAVRRMGLGVGILSNTCAAHWNWVSSQNYPVLEGPFDVAVLSYEALSMKPDSLIYEVAEQRVFEFSGATPGQILFLDDRQENVVAARRRGWNAETCFGGEEAIAALARHGIDVNHDAATGAT